MAWFTLRDKIANCILFRDRAARESFDVFRVASKSSLVELKLISILQYQHENIKYIVRIIIYVAKVDCNNQNKENLFVGELGLKYNDVQIYGLKAKTNLQTLHIDNIDREHVWYPT